MRQCTAQDVVYVLLVVKDMLKRVINMLEHLILINLEIIENRDAKNLYGHAMRQLFERSLPTIYNYLNGYLQTCSLSECVLYRWTYEEFREPSVQTRFMSSVHIQSIREVWDIWCQFTLFAWPVQRKRLKRHLN